MLETSKDLLNIIIAISVFGFTVLTCLAIFYLSMVLRQSFKIVQEMRDRLHKVDEVIKTLKEKIEHSTSYLMLIGEGVKKLVEVIKEHTDKGKKKRTVKKKKE
jgi:uncharacterized membrane protein affecting hemolysin expression